ncbi:MAG: Rieske (2Fe-2S) protein [Acidobacteria bacterium]|nr:Rieske (2Fe-2S) protein [Acidobacteriota bacterium]
MSSSDEIRDRRSAVTALIALLAGGWTAGVALLSGAFLSSPRRAQKRRDDIAVGELSIFGPEFQGVRLRIAADDGWYERVEQQTVFVRLAGNGSPEVFSGTCTHLGCTITWNVGDRVFTCPCHGGLFGPDGSVKGGPPPRPLTRLDASVRDGIVYVRFNFPAS